MSKGWSVATAAMVVALTFGAGKCSAEQDARNAVEAEKPKVIPGPTKIVTRKETVTRESMPDSCREALQLAKKIDSNAEPLINASDESLDIMADAHEAMTMQEGNRLNELRSDMYKLGSTTNESALNLKVDIAPEFTKQFKACLNTDAYRLR